MRHVGLLKHSVLSKLECMTHAPTRMLGVSTAISAVLALSAPAAAQEAAPVIDQPTATAPAPQPTIELPSQAPAPAPPAAEAAAPATVSQPVVQQVPSTPSPADVPAERAAPQPRAVERQSAARARTASTPATATTAASTIAAEPAQPAPVTPQTASVPLAQTAAPPPPAATAPRAEAPDTGSDAGLLAGGAALLAALGLGGFALSRRSRRQPAQSFAYAREPEHAERERAAEPNVAPLAAPAIEPTPHSSPAQAIAREELATQPVGERRAMAGGPVPQTRAERDDLLEQMISAPPDADNPFTSRKARLRRARIILQSREHEQKEQAGKPFDWRTYEPSTGRPTPATPPRVTA